MAGKCFEFLLLQITAVRHPIRQKLDSLIYQGYDLLIDDECSIIPPDVSNGLVEQGQARFLTTVRPFLGLTLYPIGQACGQDASTSVGDYVLEQGGYDLLLAGHGANIMSALKHVHAMDVFPVHVVTAWQFEQNAGTMLYCGPLDLRYMTRPEHS